MMSSVEGSFRVYTGGYVYTSGSDARVHSCNCVGPKNGNPVCPCQMRTVTVRNGRYIRIEDLGPVK